MIRHTVILKFKKEISPDEKQTFFTAANALASIEGVRKFEILKQISPKNNFEYGISMEFNTPYLFDQYTNHPDHVYFVEAFWLSSVSDFLEIDFEK